MPKLILGLVGSPRRFGNCEVYIKEISSYMGFDHKLELIRLPELNIMPCQACYGCIMDNPCPHNDDMERLLGYIEKADGIIIATPVYYLGAHSIFKRILDRGFLFYRYLERTFGKPCILINIYGIKDRVGVSSQALMVFASFLGLTIKANVYLKAALPGEVFFNKTYHKKARKLAEIMFSERKDMDRNGCPFCGCDIIRMKKDHFVCTLCHGKFKIDENRNPLKIKEGGIFGTPEHMFLHKKWLAGMKKQFLASRKEILRALTPLKNMGEWVDLNP
ncbi:MAG TPA: flavodoxin family protein [Syntrophorhabdaceae bacterium]|nr:flavodoxin family protein [Syntrophorhabdaceae bacterium]